MTKFIKEKKKQHQAYLVEHKTARIVYEYVGAAIATIISALLLSFSFRAFLSPKVDGATAIISSGFGGIARTISLIVEMIVGSDQNTYVVYSIAYLLLNIPVIYLAFRYISTKFAIFTTINVIIVTLITSLGDYMNIGFVDQLANLVANVRMEGDIAYQGGILARAILGAFCSGVSSTIAFKAGTSSGGIDTVSYFFALRKSMNVGHFMLPLNSAIVVTYSILSTFHKHNLADGLLILLFTIVYLLITSMVIDAINTRNRKEQIQIITKQDSLPKLLLANIPHGATIVHSKGAFTGEDRIIIYIIVSMYETPNVISLVRQADPKSFINVISVKQVYGRFFVRPNH